MDKVTSRVMKGRRLAVVLGVCLIAVIAFSAVAYAVPAAPVFVSSTPANAATLTAKPTSIVVNVTSATALKPAPAGGTLKLNGVTVPGVSVSQSPKKIYGYPAANLYVSGTNEVTATVANTSGGTLTQHWHFTLNQAPILGAVTPANASVVGVFNPTISVPFTAAAAGVTATASVNGTAVAAPTVTPTTSGAITLAAMTLPLGTNTVTVRATQGGFSSVKTWVFQVQPYWASISGAANLACTVCHTDWATNNDMGPNCASCHAGQLACNYIDSAGVTQNDGGFPHKLTNTAWEFTDAENAASRHRVSELVNPAAADATHPGAKTRFDGSQGPVLDWESELTTTFSAATYFDGSAGTYTVGQVATVTAAWEFPTISVFWSSTSTEAPSTAIKGLNQDSVIHCSDCHSQMNASGPHGGSAPWKMDANYPGQYRYAQLTKYASNEGTVVGNPAWPATVPAKRNVPLSVSGIAMFYGAATNSAVTTTSVNATSVISGWVTGTTAMANRTDGTTGSTAVICAKCHDLMNRVPGSGVVEGANTAHDSHHQDNADGSPQCINCHIGIPHGWKRPRLLVDTDKDVAPYKSPYVLGTTRATSTGKQVGDTRKLTAGWGAGFNGQGMQALSGVNNHWLGGYTYTGSVATTLGWQPYSSSNGQFQPALNVGHMGYAYWNEAGCQACGDHPGEGAPAKIEQ
ncbi:MAG: hypothetical protein WCP28_16245 [Actinomycetes bacterium]